MPVAAVGAAAVLIVGGGAYALASSHASTISVCVSHASGALYKVRDCEKGDHKLTWNKTGRQGPQGAQGPRGIQGAQGTQGTQGDQGAAGMPGSPAASIMTARTNATIGQEGYFAASGPSTMSATESDVTILTPDATTVAQNLAVRDEVSSADDNTRVYVLRVNGADTALTCSVVLGAHQCTDSAHSVTVPPDSDVTIHRAVLTGTGGGADATAVLAAWRATTP
jgi:hypothetical protein